MPFVVVILILVIGTLVIWQLNESQKFNRRIEELEDHNSALRIMLSNMYAGDPTNDKKHIEQFLAVSQFRKL